jgi:hypothetical protein
VPGRLRPGLRCVPLATFAREDRPRETWWTYLMGLAERRDMKRCQRVIAPYADPNELVLRSNLAALGPDALCELEDVLTWPQPPRDALSRSLVDRPNAEPLAQQSRSRTPTTWRACVCSER